MTVPAGAFEDARVVTVRSLDPATIGIPAPAGMRYGAYINVDFDGTAGKMSGYVRRCTGSSFADLDGARRRRDDSATRCAFTFAVERLTRGR